MFKLYSSSNIATIHINLLSNIFLLTFSKWCHVLLEWTLTVWLHGPWIDTVDQNNLLQLAKYLILAASSIIAGMELCMFVLFSVISTSLSPNDSSKSSNVILKNFVLLHIFWEESIINTKTRPIVQPWFHLSRPLTSFFSFWLIGIAKQLWK